MILETAGQRTDDWYAARCGKATASRFKDVLARLKNGAPAADRQKYLTELVVERLTGQPVPAYENAAMRWGAEQEAAARVAYEQRTGVAVEETGFVTHDVLMAGCSPDGLVDWDGLIEIKCPFNTGVHIDTLLNGMPAEHTAQVQGQMWITGRQWCDFVSYDPRMPAELQLHVQRINRDPAFIADLERQVTEFLNEVAQQVEALRRLAIERKSA
jgi:putative phage-type endonuclease